MSRCGEVEKLSLATCTRDSEHRAKGEPLHKDESDPGCVLSWMDVSNHALIVAAQAATAAFEWGDV